MSDFNANKKEQTYGNRHSILKGISRMYYELYSVFGVERVGSGKFTRVDVKRNCCRVKGFDENTRYFTIDLQKRMCIAKSLCQDFLRVG
jgi:hypothetical protein